MVYLAYVLITVAALLLTAGYSADLEMAWMAVWIFIMPWALFVAAVVIAILKILKRASTMVVIQLIVFSLFIHLGLMFEEVFIGAMRARFDAYASKLNAEEKAKRYHEAELGDGRSLYFTDEPKDTQYRLNFEHNGRRSIGKDAILRSSEKWLSKKSYVAGDMELLLSAPIYRKDAFSIRMPGKLSIGCEIKNHVEEDGYLLKTVYLDLIHKDGKFDFIESGQAFEAK